MKKTLLAALLLMSAANALAATLRVKVLDAGGIAVPGLQLRITESLTRTPYLGTTDEQGTLVQELPAGAYSISVPEGSEVLLIRLEASEERVLTVRLEARELVPVLSSASMQPPASPETDPSLDPIREYQIQQAAEEHAPRQALTSAELVNVFPARKGGRFHGSLYEFHRNDNFDARNFFDPVGEPLPEYKRNQFGLTASLALTKSFNVLGNFEGLRITQGSTLLSHVPTAAEKAGDFSLAGVELTDPASGQPFPGNRIPDSRIHEVSRRLLPLLPDPNRADADRNFVNSKPIVRDRTTWSVRLDREGASGSSSMARYWRSDGKDANVYPLPGFGSTRESTDQDLSLSHTERVTSRLLANFRLGFARNTSFLRSVNAGQDGLLSSIGIAGLSDPEPDYEGYPDFRLSGYAAFGDGGLPVTATFNRFEFEAGVTFSPENHSVRIGAELTRNQVNNNSSDGVRRGRFSYNGYYTGNAFADFLLGLPDTATRGVGSDRADQRRNSWYIYARDDWKIGRRLTVSAGLTYNYFEPFRSIHENVSTFYPLILDPPRDGSIVVIGSPEADQLGLGRAGEGGTVFPDRNDMAPSFGVAYRPLGSNRLIVRGSYSLGYSPLSRDYFVSYLGRNYPFYYIETAQSPIDRADLDIGNPFETAVPAELTVRGIEPELRTSYVHYWQFGIQNEIIPLWNVEAWYQGNKAVHVPRVIAGNVGSPAAGPIQPRRSNPGYGRFNILTGGGAYSSHSLDLALERRLSQGLSVKSGFDWQSSIGDVFYGNPSNPRNLAAERAVSSYPARQFFFNYIVDLPLGKGGWLGGDVAGLGQALLGGWRLSGMTHVNSGYRFSVFSGGDPNNDGVPDDRPDRIAAGTLSAPSIDAWFDTAAFADPLQFSYGNAGRNILTGPAYINWDLSVIKQTRFSNGDLVELRVELFNAFNNVNFETPYAVYGTSLFGKIFGAHRSREIEVALRYSF